MEKKQTLRLPEQPKEIAEEVYRCLNAGAAIAHIHARDPKGIPTNDANVFKEIKAEISAKSNIINNSVRHLRWSQKVILMMDYRH